MLAQLVNLCLLIIAKIANTEGCMTNREIKSKQLAERWSRYWRCDNKVMIIVVTSENLVIALSVIGRECQSEKRYLHFISQLERKISKTETVGSDSIRSDSLVRKPVQDCQNYAYCKGNRVVYQLLHPLLNVVLPLQRSIVLRHIASCIGSCRSHLIHCYSPFDYVLIIFVPDVRVLLIAWSRSHAQNERYNEVLFLYILQVRGRCRECLQHLFPTSVYW